MRGMTSDEKDSKTGKPSGRSQRLAVELRENLRKRKAQERGADRVVGLGPASKGEFNGP